MYGGKDDKTPPHIETHTKVPATQGAPQPGAGPAAHHRAMAKFGHPGAEMDKTEASLQTDERFVPVQGGYIRREDAVQVDGRWVSKEDAKDGK